MSPDHAPDDPPETPAATATGSPTAAVPMPSRFEHAASYVPVGVSPTSHIHITGPSPTTPVHPPAHAPARAFTDGALGTTLPSATAPPQLEVATGLSLLDGSGEPSSFAASPAQLTPYDSVSPTTPPAALASSSASHDRIPIALRRKANTTGNGHPEIDPLQPMPAAISFPDDSATQHFDGPSSAPPTPSVISVTHPSQFIHTHHPRRGSLTPLGLNVISPVPPPQVGSRDGAFPIRSVGFNAAGSSDAHSEPSRRDSSASVASNLTATRPAHYAMFSNSAGAAASSSSSSSSPSTVAAFLASGRRSSLTPSLPNLAPPANFNASKRRSSLTPSLPTLSAPSPTRALAAGRVATRPAMVDASFSLTSRTIDSMPNARRASAAATLGGNPRRGSLPHLYYGAWTGPATPRNVEPWIPTLPSQRGSVDDTAVIDSSFKFGCPPNSAAAELRPDTEGSTSQLRMVSSSTSSPRKDLSVFEATEQQEADRQRRAFLAATYGEDSRRARARLSLGGPSGASPGSPASTRRQSLLLWERINKPPEGTVLAGAAGINPVSAVALAAVAAAAAAAAPGTAFVQDEHGRRPSLPISIPMRTPPTETTPSFDDQSIWDNPDSIDPDATPVRPLPPLLPLSDPVPRLLPSTLALHRATHLLNARGVSSEPLPAPLPPSLHPPAPVDLSEFDIDFILAGSRPNLGRQGSPSNSSKLPASDLQPNGPPGEEDSFAKFVGAFDDEYGDRRGDWTFRASTVGSSQNSSPGVDDTSDSLASSSLASSSRERPRPRAEWDSPGAGRYEIYPNGDVRSVESGGVWRIRKTSAREYEFEQPLRSPHHLLHPQVSDTAERNALQPQPLVLAACGGFTLTTKVVHAENGGVKLPLLVQRELTSKGRRVSRRFAAAKHRQSSQSVMTTHSSEGAERKRIGSEDSGATAIPIGHVKPHRHSHDPPHATTLPNHTFRLSSARPSMSSPASPIDEAHLPHHPTPKELKRLSRGRKDKDKDKDNSEDDRQKKTIGGVLKRGLFRAQSLVKDYEERSRDRHLFTNGGSSAHREHSGSGSTRYSPARPSPTERPSDRSDTASASSQHSSGKHTMDSADELAEWPEGATFGSLGLGIEDEQNGGQPWKEGKAWEVVPDEALAMVIPIESDSRAPNPRTPAATQPFINPFFVDGPRQALLVWFTPFDASTGPKGPPLSSPPPLGDTRLSSTSTLFKIPESPHHEREETSPHGTTLRLPKLLRPRGHRSESNPQSPLATSKTIAVPPPTTTPPLDLDMHRSMDGPSPHESRSCQPLPFRSFRVVAKVVDTEELRSEPEVPVIALEQWAEQRRTGKPVPGLHTPPFEDPVMMIASEASRSPSIDSGVLGSVVSGRAFPTVIAVCHSHKAGVEFVLEGLDRLGLCTGNSAWGPTGYEEWRGTGLSESGRQALDLLWTACTAVMGI